MATKTYCDSCGEEIHDPPNRISISQTRMETAKPVTMLELCNVCWPKLGALIRRIKDGRLNLREMIGATTTSKTDLTGVEV